MTKKNLKREQKSSKSAFKISFKRVVNFIFVWGCRPSTQVSNSEMLGSIFDAFLKNQELGEASVRVPDVFNELHKRDPSFEVAQSNQF